MNILKKYIRRQTWMVFAFVIAVSGSVCAQDVQSNMSKFGRLLRLVESYYVDTADVARLTEVAIESLLKELDPHSVYISKEEVDKMNEPLQGSFEGVGITFNILNDTLVVLTTIPGGPSEKVGLRPGDRILKVDEKNIAGIGLKNNDVFDLLRGEKGTRVQLSILRKSEKDLLEFIVIRDKIPIFSLDASYMIDNHTGYVKLNRFSATTVEEFVQAIQELKSKHAVQNLVLDLRGNGGGYLKAAIDLADQFLEANKMVVYTEGVNSDRKDYRATQQGEFESGRLLVLIDEGSASASEIVAGAVQDWDRGLILGRRSFGKGLVQQPFYLNDGSMVRLTTAHYYTPSGRGIQKPYDGGVEEYRNDRLKRFESGELFSQDSIRLDPDLMHKTLVNQRSVYSNGGIMPDIFVPMDTSARYQYYNQLVRKNIINTSVISYLDKNRERIAKEFAEFSDYKNQFDVPESMIADIVQEGISQGVEKDEQSLEFTREIMRKQIKALIARDLFSNSHYYEIINSDDSTIVKAMEVLKKNGEYNRLLVAK